MAADYERAARSIANEWSVGEVLKSAGVCTEPEEEPAKVRQQESMSEDGVKEGAQQRSSGQQEAGALSRRVLHGKLN